MNSTDKYYDKLSEMAVEIKEKILSLIKEKKIESLNLLPYYDEGYVQNHTFYDIDNNGNGIAYNLDTIIVKDNGLVVFQMSDNDCYYIDNYTIKNFNCVEALYVLDILEQVFDAVEEYNLPLLKEFESFNDYEKE